MLKFWWFLIVAVVFMITSNYDTLPLLPLYNPFHSINQYKLNYSGEDNIQRQAKIKKYLGRAFILWYQAMFLPENVENLNCFLRNSRYNTYSKLERKLGCVVL